MILCMLPLCAMCLKGNDTNSSLDQKQFLKIMETDEEKVGVTVSLSFGGLGFGRA